MKLPAYPRTKPSGVEWLGDVPEHWEVKRLKYSASINDDALPETTLPDFEFKYVDIGGVNAVDGITATEELVFENAPSRARRKVRHGDTIVSTVRTYLRAIAPIKNPPENLIVSTGFAVVRPRKVEAAFLAYALRESSFIESVVARSTGVSYPACNASEVGGTAIPLPTPDEQRSIATFLDRETGRVDQLVAKKRELIERLKEKRTALISQTVTRGLPAEAAAKAGLPANPPLKPSGTDWIGDVPKHWEVKKVKFVAKMESGHTPSRSEPSNWVDDECVIPWVSLNDTKHLKENDYIGDTAVKISEEGMKNSSAHLLPAGVVVFTRDATIGLTAITTCPAAVSQHIIAWVPGPKITPKYLLLSFKAMQQYLESFTFGSTLKTIGMTDVRKLVTPVPPLPEQAAIAAYLEEETGKLDALVGKVEEAVERLQEYRTALITAAVTGKIDVRGYEPKVNP